MALDSSEAELDSLLAQLDEGDKEAEVVDDVPNEEEWRSSKRLSQALSIKVDDLDLDSLDSMDTKKKSSSSSSDEESAPVGAPPAPVRASAIASGPPRSSVSTGPRASVTAGSSGPRASVSAGSSAPRASVTAPRSSTRASVKAEPSLDSLEADLDRLEVAPAGRTAPSAPRDSYTSASRRMTRSAGCAKCGGSLVGDALQACNKLWHTSCFSCRDCNTELGTKEFYEHEDGVAYCMGCAKRRFLPQCDACRSPIEGRMLKAMGRQFHEHCFTCSVCRATFPDGSFWENSGVAYCKTHYYDKFGIRCAGCSGIITSDKALKALGKFYHKEHFVCTRCGVGFPDGQFYEKDGQPYCKDHYHSATGTICAKCNGSISGTMIKALGKNWHSTCFICTSCSNPLSGSVMMVKKSGAEDPWCTSCYNRTYKSG